MDDITPVPTDALAPCPFCSGPALIKPVASDWWKLTIDHSEECALSGHFDDAIVPQDDESRQWLIDRWNRRAQPAPAASPAPLTRQQLREAYYRSTGCTLGNDIHLAERVCSVVEQAHGITPVAGRARLGTNQPEGQNVPRTFPDQSHAGGRDVDHPV